MTSSERDHTRIRRVSTAEAKATLSALIGAVAFGRDRVVIERRGRPVKRRVSKHPLIEIARARHKEDALAGLERWKKRHPKAAAHLQPADVLVDAMRGRYSTWTRIRVNLQNVPVELHPAQEPLDPDEKMRSSS
jgi:hypothetical protein